MKEKELQDDLVSIRSMMERSSKFISLSGLSGILAGVYALIGAGIAYGLLYTGPHTLASSYAGDSDTAYVFNTSGIAPLFVVALAVLIASLLTGAVLTSRKAKRKGQQVWGSTSRLLLFNMAVPLVTGGLFVLLLIYRGYFGMLAPACLVFYGLALIAAGNFTFKDVRYLGLSDITLGLLAALLPGYGLLFWAIGFGVLHIVYGSIMYFKYDK